MFAWIVTLVEFLGGLALLLGVPTRVVAVLIGVDMVFAILLWHLSQGCNYQGGGFEYPLVLLFTSVTLLLAGPGRLAPDRIVLDRETAAPSGSASGSDCSGPS